YPHSAHLESMAAAAVVGGIDRAAIGLLCERVRGIRMLSTKKTRRLAVSAVLLLSRQSRDADGLAEIFPRAAAVVGAQPLNARHASWRYDDEADFVARRDRRGTRTRANRVGHGGQLRDRRSLVLRDANRGRAVADRRDHYHCRHAGCPRGYQRLFRRGSVV